MSDLAGNQAPNDKYSYVWPLLLKPIEGADYMLASTAPRRYKCQDSPSTVEVRQLPGSSVKITRDKIWCHCANRKAMRGKCLRDTRHCQTSLLPYLASSTE